MELSGTLRKEMVLPYWKEFEVVLRDLLYRTGVQ